MVRADIFDRIGAFDESMLTVLENLDFCLAVARVPPHHRLRLPASERHHDRGSKPGVEVRIIAP